MDLTISKFAQAEGVSVETIRFYQRKGLLSVPDAVQGFRRYGVSEQQCLRFIRKAQAAGFTLKEIAELLALDASRDRRQIQQLASARLAALDEQIRSLEQARADLNQLVQTCSDSDRGPCPIVEAFTERCAKT